MNAIDRYNLARDREQHAFEVSPLGQHVRDALNASTMARMRGEAEPALCLCLPVSLAAEAAFKASMPAFYAGRSLRIW